jgi:hypothetical protein
MTVLVSNAAGGWFGRPLIEPAMADNACAGEALRAYVHSKTFITSSP